MIPRILDSLSLLLQCLLYLAYKIDLFTFRIRSMIEDRPTLTVYLWSGDQTSPLLYHPCLLTDAHSMAGWWIFNDRPVYRADRWRTVDAVAPANGQIWLVKGYGNFRSVEARSWRRGCYLGRPLGVELAWFVWRFVISVVYSRVELHWSDYWTAGNFRSPPVLIYIAIRESLCNNEKKVCVISVSFENYSFKWSKITFDMIENKVPKTLLNYYSK